MEQVDDIEPLPLNHYLRYTSDDTELWSIDHYARDMSEHILNYVFNTGKFPNVQFAEGSVGPETQPQLVNNTMVVTVPPEIDRSQFAFALETNYQNGVNLEIEYGNSNSQCKISIFKPNVTSHDGALNEVKILNQQNKYQPTYYRLVQKDNNYLIMACTAASLEEKKMIQNQYEAGNNYNRSFENRTLSDSGPQDAKKTYLRALRHFAITGKMPEDAAEQAPDENDTDERALHAACAILEEYNDDRRQKYLKNSLVALLSKSNLPQEETLTEFAKCLVHVVSKIDDTHDSIERIEHELEGERNKFFKQELLYNVYDLGTENYFNYNEEFESEDIYDLDGDINKLVEGKMYIPKSNTQFSQPRANDLRYNNIHYDNGVGLLKITKNVCNVKGRGKFEFKGRAQFINDEANVLRFYLNDKQIEVPWEIVDEDDGENYKVHCCLDADVDFQDNYFTIEVPKDKQKVIDNVVNIEEIVENTSQAQNNNSYKSEAPIGLPSTVLADNIVNEDRQLYNNNNYEDQNINKNIISDSMNNATSLVPPSIENHTNNTENQNVNYNHNQLNIDNNQYNEDDDNMNYTEINEYANNNSNYRADQIYNNNNSQFTLGNNQNSYNSPIINEQHNINNNIIDNSMNNQLNIDNNQNNNVETINKSVINMDYNNNNMNNQLNIDNNNYENQNVNYNNNQCHIDSNNGMRNAIKELRWNNIDTTITKNITNSYSSNPGQIGKVLSIETNNNNDMSALNNEIKNVAMNNNEEGEEQVDNPDLAQIAEARAISISDKKNHIHNNQNDQTILNSARNTNYGNNMYDYNQKNSNNNIAIEDARGTQQSGGVINL